MPPMRAAHLADREECWAQAPRAEAGQTRHPGHKKKAPKELRRRPTPINERRALQKGSIFFDIWQKISKGQWYPHLVFPSNVLLVTSLSFHHERPTAKSNLCVYIFKETNLIDEKGEGLHQLIILRSLKVSKF
jgi:hypothetical protein